jgi:cytochrome c oxidase cbb3-type subunit III
MDLYTAVGAASTEGYVQTLAYNLHLKRSGNDRLGSHLLLTFGIKKSREGMPVRYLMCGALVVASVASIAIGATSQETPNGGQEGVQQKSDQTMTPEKQAAATRTFLGLGSAPDKTAALRGEPLFSRNCAFCHGQNARGATGPSLITSDVVLSDDHGEHLRPFLKKGSPAKGMPAFATMSDQQLTDVGEFLHLQVEEVANRGGYQVLNIVVGNAASGKAYVERNCMSCHTTKTFEHIASRFHSPEQLQRNWIWPARAATITANVKTFAGKISGRVVQLSDFEITLDNGSGPTQTIDRRPGVVVEVHDPRAAHQAMVMTLANEDMHNVTAYLETLK